MIKGSSLSLLNSSTQCSALTGNNTQFSTVSVLFDNTTNQSSVVAQLPAGDTCGNGQNYQLTYNYICNVNQTTPIIDYSAFVPTSCANKISITTNQACPEFNVYALWNAIIANAYIFGSIISVLGFILCFLGIKFIFFTEIMIGVAAAMFLSLYLIFSNVTFALSTWQFWTIVAVSAVLGALAGWLIAKVERLPGGVLGGIVGFILGFVIYNFMMKYINSNPTVVYWCCIVFSIIICALLGLWLSDYILIIGTSIVGGYAAIRGISFMAGGFPDEKQVYQLIQNQEWNQVSALMTWQVYVYLSCFLVLAVIGMFIQFKYFHETEEEKTKREKEEKEKEALLANKN